MRVTRFCSKLEYAAFLVGDELVNFTDHFQGGRGGSLSIGFCFSPDEPEVAIHYLCGTVDTEVCMVLDFPEGYLKESKGKYRDLTVDPYSDVQHCCLRTEYCCERYDNKVAKLVGATEEYHKFYPNARDIRALFMP